MYVFILPPPRETDSMDLPTYDLARKAGMSETMKVEHERAT